MPNIMDKKPFPHGLRGQLLPEPEDARLRRLANVQSVIHPRKHNMAVPLPPLDHQTASTPNLHDFATRTHMTRLDIAYEKLDTYVEQTVEQIRTGLDDKLRAMETWVEQRVSACEDSVAQKVGVTEEKLTGALLTVQQTRSVLDNAVSSLSAAKGGSAAAESELRTKIASLEERLLDLGTMRDRLAPTETQLIDQIRERVTSLDTQFSSQIRERLVSVEEQLAKSAGKGVMNAGMSAAIDAELRARIASCEERLVAEICSCSQTSERIASIEERLAMEKLDSPKGVNSPKAESRLKALEEKVKEKMLFHTAIEEKLNRVGANVDDCRSALEMAIGDVARYSSDKSVTKDMHTRIFDARADSLQAAVSEIAGELEALRSQRHPVFDEQAREKTALEERLNLIQKQISANEALAREALTTNTEDRLSALISATEAAAKESMNADMEERLTVLKEEMAKDVEQRVLDCIDRLGSKTAKLQVVEVEETEEPSVTDAAVEADESEPGASSEPPEALEEQVAEQIEESTGPASQKEFIDFQARMQKEVFDVRARMEGGFEALLVRMEASRYITEHEDRAADHINQMFAFNMDERIQAIEAHMHKNDSILEKLMEKTHIKFKRFQVPVRCTNCGKTNGHDVEVCKHCGAKRAAELTNQLTQQHKVRLERHRLKQELIQSEKERVDAMRQEKNDRLLDVCFDLWARGKSAECLQPFRKASTRIRKQVVIIDGETVTPRVIAVKPSTGSLSTGGRSEEAISPHREETEVTILHQYDKAALATEAPESPQQGNITISVNISRDSDGSTGLKLDTETLMIVDIEKGRPELSNLEVGDSIIGVNDVPVKNFEEYLREAKGVPKFRLSLYRAKAQKTLATSWSTPADTIAAATSVVVVASASTIEAPE
jgi:hypothetical protein